MTDLKYQSVKELIASREATVKYISNLKSRLAGQEERLNWIDRYIYEQTPQELTLRQIENILGHKIILKK